MVKIGKAGANFEKEDFWDFLGYIDNDNKSHGVIGEDQYLLNIKEEIYVAIAIGEPGIRNKLYLQYKGNSNLRFSNLMIRA